MFVLSLVQYAAAVIHILTVKDDQNLLLFRVLESVHTLEKEGHYHCSMICFQDVCPCLKI